jgi:hypothetical protein
MRRFQLAMSVGLAGLVGMTACGQSSEPIPPPAPATAGTGGKSGTGGSKGTGGSAGSASGGQSGGGTTGSGGSTGSGGTAPAGSGGTTGSGGSAGTGGSPASDAASEVSAPSDAPAGSGNFGGLGPLSPDDSPPLVLPGSHLIFDGKTLTGWMCDPGRWTVKDGAINAKGNGNNFCLTEGDYDTFRLTGKSRMVQNPQNHAGICWWGGRSQGGGGCLQMTPASGSLWDYSGGEVRTLKRVFDYTKWNFFELVVNLKTGTVMIAVNGHAYDTYTDKKLGSRKKGPIALQLHAGFSELEYKDLSLEENPKEDKLLTVIPGQ